MMFTCIKRKQFYKSLFFFLLINSIFNIYSMDIDYVSKQNKVVNVALNILNTSFKKEPCHIIENYSLHDPIFNFLSTVLKLYASKSFVCTYHNDISIKCKMHTTKNNLESFFSYIAAAEVFSCTSKKWYHALKPSLTEAKHEFAYLLCTDWLPAFEKKIETDNQKKYAFSDEFHIIYELSFARFIGYYLAKGDYKGYKKLQCIFHSQKQDPCKNVRKRTERRRVEGVQKYEKFVAVDYNTKEYCGYRLVNLIYFSLFHDKNISINTVNEDFNKTLQTFTMTILKIWAFYRNKENDLHDIFSHDGRNGVQFYINYFSKNDFEQAIKETSFGKLLKDNGMFIMPQEMGEGHYKNKSLNKIRYAPWRIILCPANRSIKNCFYGLIYTLYDIYRKNYYMQCLIGSLIVFSIMRLLMYIEII